jgi:hypothetical protein
VGGELHVVGRGDHDVRDDTALEAAHPVREDLGRDPADRLEALREHGHRGGGLLVGGEPHETNPRPRQHRAEHLDPAKVAPVDDQVLTRGPHSWAPPTVVLAAPLDLRSRDQAAEVARRPGEPRRPRRRQQPLRRDPAPCRGDLRRDQTGHRLVVADPRDSRRGGPAGLGAGDDPLDGLGARATDRGRPPIRPDLLIGADDVHTVPRRLQWSSPGSDGDWLDTATVTARATRSGSTRRARGGDFYLATSGDFLLATCGDFLMATDTRNSLSN